MNHDHETPPKDPKRETGEQAVLRNIQPGEPSPDAAPFMLTKPDETPPQGDDMPVEPELHDVERRVRQLESYRAYAEDRLTRHTQRLDSHDLRLDGIMSREQLSALIDDKFHLQYESIDAAYARAEKLVNELTTQFSANITAQHNILVQMKTIQDAGNERNTLLNTVVSALSIMAGYDIKDPQARKIGTSVTETANKAIEIANRAEDNVANMRIDAAAIAAQIKGWYDKAKLIEAQLARAEEADRIAEQERRKQAERQAAVDKRNQQIREFIFNIIKDPAFWLKFGISGGATFAGLLKVLGVF